jgi:hypothetical protein
LFAQFRIFENRKVKLLKRGPPQGVSTHVSKMVGAGRAT